MIHQKDGHGNFLTLLFKSEMLYFYILKLIRLNLKLIYTEAKNEFFSKRYRNNAQAKA